MALVIFMRHGETHYNVQKRLTGRGSDPELTENGIAQAEEVGRILYEHHIDKIDLIVSSNMTRTNQTAAIINQFLQKPMHFDVDLQEVHRGGLEGLLLEHALPEINALEEHESHPIHGGESTLEFTQRVTSSTCKYLNSPHEAVLIVSHGFSGAMVTRTLVEEEIHLSNLEFVIIDPENIDNFPGKCGMHNLNNYGINNSMEDAELF